MQKIVVRGGKPLYGNINASGSKNAALPLIFASLLASGVTVLNNVPDIGDVSVALKIISTFGARVSRVGHSLAIDTTSLKYSPVSRDLISKIRASTYLIGASLARFGTAEINDFGGCNFSLRPIDFHLMAAESLGAKIVGKRLFAAKLFGAQIRLPKPSVGATVNAAIMASAAEGETEIFGYAREPHVLSVLDFLSSMGAKISVSEDRIKIVGARLCPTEFTVIGDMCEAATYLLAALITGGRVSVGGIDFSELSSFSESISSMGYRLQICDDCVIADSRLKTEAEPRNIFINASPYPGFPTDLQPLIVPLISKLGGTVSDSVWQERFGYLASLGEMGVEYSLGNGWAKIEKSALRSAKVSAPDLRGGMALLLSALAAEGTSEIYFPEIILRGYDNLINKLSSLGAGVALI